MTEFHRYSARPHSIPPVQWRSQLLIFVLFILASTALHAQHTTALTINQVVEIIEQQAQGKIIRVIPPRETNDYQVERLSKDGKVYRLLVDAHTGVIKNISPVINTEK